MVVDSLQKMAAVNLGTDPIKILLPITFKLGLVNPGADPIKILLLIIF
jgi:hypothetical protein